MGYYNGITDVLTGSFNEFTNSRTPNNNGLAGILTIITYPTKGYTRFEYQINNYSQRINELNQIENSLGEAGGARISKIINFDGIKEESKEYFYVKNYLPDVGLETLISSGILSKKIYYIKIFNSNPYYYEYFSSNPLLPMNGSSNNYHIGYSEVVEKRQGVIL